MRELHQRNLQTNHITIKMVHITSYVFFDIETTGLPWQERNQTKITELCFVAVSREDIERASKDSIVPMSKLSLNFDPQRDIPPIVTEITGLSNELLQFSTTFDKKLKTIISFLEELPKPICLIAHNGNRFDYKILLAEFEDADVALPLDLFCADSLTGFQRLLKGTTEKYTVTSSSDKKVSRNVVDSTTKEKSFINSIIDDSIMTDDEDEWPELNVSTEEWREIDDLSSSLSCSQISSSTPNKSEKPHFKMHAKKNVYTLTALYELLLNKKASNAHRAEFDCLMLLECVIAKKDVFLQWVDKNCKYLTEIKPLKRY